MQGKPITVTFESDNPDNIALIMAAWELIVRASETEEDQEPSFLLLGNYIELHNIITGAADEMHKHALLWDDRAAAAVRRAFPNVDTLDKP